MILDKFPKKHRFLETKGYFPNNKNEQVIIKNLNIFGITSIEKAQNFAPIHGIHNEL